jgi:potassium efflux system protein
MESGLRQEVGKIGPGVLEQSYLAQRPSESIFHRDLPRFLLRAFQIRIDARRATRYCFTPPQVGAGLSGEVGVMQADFHRQSRRAQEALLDACLRIAAVMLALALPGARAAESPPSPTAAGEAAPSVENLVEALKSRKLDPTLLDELAPLLRLAEPPEGLSDPDKSKWRDRRREALSALDAALHFAGKAADFAAQADQAPAQLAKLRDKLAAPSAEIELVSDDASLTELEQKVIDRQAALAKAQEALLQAEDEIKRRAARRVEIPKLLAAANARLEELEQQFASPAPELPDELLSMNRAALLAEKLAKRAEIDAYQKEILKYDAAAELAPLERDKAARELHREETALANLRQLVDRRRTADAQESARQAQLALEQSAKAHPQVRKIAHENAVLAQERKRLAEKLQQMTQDLERERLASAARLKHFKDVRDKDRLADVASRGVLLHKQIKLLPDRQQLQRELRAVASELAAAQLNYLEHAAERSELADPQRVIAATLGNLSDEPLLLQALEQHFQTKRATLDALLQTYDQYILKLTLLQTHRQELAKKTDEYREYIAERVLWIRSTTPLRWKDLAAAGPIAAWLGDRKAWLSTLTALGTDAARHPALYAFAGMGLVGLLAARRRLRVRIRELGEIAARSRTDTFRPTAIAAFDTALITSVWPTLPAFFAWRLTTLPPYSQGYTLGCAVLITILVHLPLELLRQVCRPRGLAEAHFDWSSRGIGLLRRSLRELMCFSLPLLLATSMLHLLANDEWDSSIGRATFLLTMLVVARFIWQVLRPGGGVLDETLARDRGGWLDRLRWVWFAVFVGAPLALAGLAATGFYYTALQLVWRLEATLALLLGLLLTHSLLLRLLMVVRRRLAIEQARQRRAALVESRDAGADAVEGDFERLDLAVVSQQTRHLLQSAVVCAAMLGMCAVWIDVLPALKKLNQYELWQVSATAITLGNLLAALLIGMMTVLAARNIPGLLEISILQKLPLQPGSGYAITTICRYAIVVVGLIWAASKVGLQWNQVQWLVAAISVGLGFGLQEIFGNFISGLIILFERPIRVGDMITVGQFSGAVSRIRMRATTLLDPDRKELIIPNKEFITGQVINWTLSDDVIRLVIRLQVEVGADPALAQRLILKAAQEHPNVLKDPPPSAYLESLRDHALEFQLCVFLPTLSGGAKTRHEILETIARSFQAAGIELAQPPLRWFEQRRSA